MNWDHPDFEAFRIARDTDQDLRSLETALPLVKKQLAAQPLTAIERMYLEGFYKSPVCMEFFCRLGMVFANNSPCWLNGPPTEEQCQRCKFHYLSSNILAYGRSDIEPVAEEDAIVGLHVIKTDGVTTFEWRSQEGDRKGLTGDYWSNGYAMNRPPLEKVFPVCLPSLSPSFDNTCNHDCANCPAHGFYDSVDGVTLAGKGTVRLNNKNLPPRVVEQLQARAATPAEEIPASERIDPPGPEAQT